MNRLQKKCLIASSAFHGLLLLILLFGAALMPAEKVSPASRITFFDMSRVTDGPTHGSEAAAPEAVQLPPTPPPSAPTPALPAQPISQPQPVVHQPQPQPDEFKPAPVKSSDSPSFKPVKTTKPSTDEFTPTDHAAPKVKQVANNNAQADAQAKAAAARQQRLQNEINSSLKQLSGKLGKATAVQVGASDDSGPAAANYRDLVYSTYYQAWAQPSSLNESALKVIVSITVARDGHVVRHEIIKPSGNAAMDKSVDNVLDNVSVIAAFPDNSKDTERTFTLSFSPEMNQ